MQMKGARGKQVQERLRQVSLANLRMYVFLAIVAVIGGWVGHQRIEQRLEARARIAANTAAVAPDPVRLAIEITTPAAIKPATLNALEQAIRQ